jgi:hypothetical protein
MRFLAAGMEGEKSGTDAGFCWLGGRGGGWMGENGEKSGDNRHFYQ